MSSQANPRHPASIRSRQLPRSAGQAREVTSLSVSPEINLSCEPCIDRASYTVKVIVHGTSDDVFWQKVAKAQRQSASDMRINLDLKLYPPGGFSESRMAGEIRAAASSFAAPPAEEGGRPDALIVTVPSPVVASAVRDAARQGMPIFGLNSGFQEVVGPDGLVADGSMLFFTTMDEFSGGERAAQYFLQQFPLESLSQFQSALFISPAGEESNSAYDQRFDGFREQILSAPNSSIQVEKYSVNIHNKAQLQNDLVDKLENCTYQAILLGTGRLASHAMDAILTNGCRNKVFLGTFDNSELISNSIAQQRLDFAIDQQGHIQAWSPVIIASLYVTTGLVLAPTQSEVYMSGPVLIDRENLASDTLRACADQSFPVCPKGDDNAAPAISTNGCPCADRSSIRIGGVVHGVTTDEFWDSVFDAAQRGADDMGVELDFHRFEPQSSPLILFRKMSAKILSLCQSGTVDGIFVSMPDELVVDAVRMCLDLAVPVVSINAGFAESKELGLIHHIGMVEYNAGNQAGLRLISLANFTKAFCLNHAAGVKAVADRCLGFEAAMKDSMIEYGGMIKVPDDNIKLYHNTVEQAVGDYDGDWAEFGFLIGGSAQIPAALELKKIHPGFTAGTFDVNDLTYEALDSDQLLFAVSQQAYLQGYMPLSLLTHKAYTNQALLDHAIESGPSFLFSSPSPEKVQCEALSYFVCPEFPIEDFNYIHSALVAVGYSLFAIQAYMSIAAITWTIVKRKTRVIRASQPEFLVLVAVGCAMMSSAILPLTIEGEYRYEQDTITGNITDVPNEDIAIVDAACMAVPWLVCCGFVLVYSALFAKLRRVTQVMKNAQRFRSVEIKAKDVALIVVFFLAAMIAILLSWQLVSPLQWEREVLEYDPETNYPIESSGKCTSEHQVAFISACGSFVGLCLIYATYLSYMSWDIPSDLSESKYIAFSIISILQLLILGIPIIFATKSQPDAQFLVLMIIVFLMSSGVTVLIFVPKVAMHLNRNRRSTTRSFPRMASRYFTRETFHMETVVHPANNTNGIAH